ncbi:glycosyltransferase family 17 protein [Cystoisospora suis]|uniref:Glycosyltransferase family 17 protein n=1 Tax=Cystoisospora suis TaxID=483139 RepID=A0A2C6KY55_9APIC|nr:glycosyltransferase family 17 protein [Cystoisospora suis]
MPTGRSFPKKSSLPRVFFWSRKGNYHCLPPDELPSTARTGDGQAQPSSDCKGPSSSCVRMQEMYRVKLRSSFPYKQLERWFLRCCRCLAPTVVVVCSLLGLVIWRRSIEGVVTVNEFREAFFGNSYGFFTKEYSLKDARPGFGDWKSDPGGTISSGLTSRGTVLPSTDAVNTLVKADSQHPTPEEPIRLSFQVIGDDGTVSAFLQQAFQEPPGQPYFCGDGNYPAKHSSPLRETREENTSSLSSLPVSAIPSSPASSPLSSFPSESETSPPPACLPAFVDALRAFDWRLKESWASRRWQYHWSEYVRKALTLFFPLDRRSHEEYRHEMAAVLAFATPYVEIEPPVPVNPSCFPPSSYTVLPAAADRDQGGTDNTTSGREGRIRETSERKVKVAGSPDFGIVARDSRGQTTQKTGSNLNLEHELSSLGHTDRGRVSARGGQEGKGTPKAKQREKSHESGRGDATATDLGEYCKNAREVHRGAFTGSPRVKPVTIVDSVILGYDLDILEVRFYELEYAVDYFVVLEAPHHTTGLFEKPLLFKQNRHRFTRFLPKIIYFEMPRFVSEHLASYCAERFLRDFDNCWRFEFSSRDVLLWMLARLNEGVDEFGNSHVRAPIVGPDDLIMTGDPDEIVRGDRLLHLKFCEPVEQETLGWALIHYPGRVDAMAKKEFGSDPRLVTDVPFAIGPLMDTFRYRKVQYLHSVEDPRHLGHVFERHALSSLNPPLYLYGGWHMSDMSYLPFLMSKIPVDDNKPGYEPWSIYRHLVRGDVDLAQREVWEKFRDYRQVAVTVISAKQVPPQYKDLGFGAVPWVVRCNPLRYPTWFSLPDRRYFLRPRKSFYHGSDPVNARTASDWRRLLREIRAEYRVPGH